ncbi:MAG: dTMP kinase [Candidatus Omnitrophica bacterium]|nr:dTMP kinase [Candidatus Omnitrophota bacterium]
MAEKIKRGVFITFEGPEGSGKSTQAGRVAEELRKEGHDVVYTAEPGGTPLGDRIRDILLQKDGIRLGRVAELLLFEADRAQHVEDMIAPALQEGKIVICDRFNTATLAYQGYGLGMDLRDIVKIDSLACGGVTPDLTVLLDIEVETGLKRAGKVGKADRMEKRSLEFHNRVRKGYLDLAAASEDRMKIIQVRDSRDETYSEVREVIYSFLEKRV